MLEQNWTNPNEPREGSRRSTRKRVFKEPTVIQHRLLLGPTLARRKARKRRKEQEKNAEMAGKESKKDESSRECVTRRDELSRKLGPHNSTLPDNVLSQQPPSSTANVTSDTTTTLSMLTTHRAEYGAFSCILPTGQMEALPKQQKSKGRKKKKSKIRNEQMQSGFSGVTASHSQAPTAFQAPDANTPSNSTPTSPPLQRTAEPPTQRIHNPSAPTSAMVSPVGLSHCNHEIQSITASWSRQQMLEDSNTLQMLKKRERAIQIMQASTDVPSIIASSRLVREFYVGSLMDRATQTLLEDAEGRGLLWLSKLLIGSFSKPIILGGLGFPPTKARLIADEIVIGLADMIGKIDLSYETLLGLRILPHDAVAIAPILRVYGTAIKEKSLAFRQDIIMKAETSFYAGLPSMFPTAASAYSPLATLGVATAYGY